MDGGYIPELGNIAFNLIIREKKKNKSLKKKVSSRRDEEEEEEGKWQSLAIGVQLLKRGFRVFL